MKTLITLAVLAMPFMASAQSSSSKEAAKAAKTQSGAPQQSASPQATSPTKGGSPTEAVAAPAAIMAPPFQIPGGPGMSVPYYYIEVAMASDGKNTKLSLRMNDDIVDHFFGERDLQMISEVQEHKYSSVSDAMTFLSVNGWEYVDQYQASEEGTQLRYFIFRTQSKMKSKPVAAPLSGPGAGTGGGPGSGGQGSGSGGGQGNGGVGISPSPAPAKPAPVSKPEKKK